MRAISRMLEIGVDQHERNRAALGMPEEVGIAHFLADDLRHLHHGPIVGGDHHAFPLAARFDHDQCEKVLRSHGTLQFAVEHEFERARGQKL
jgi:hypothetical protein